MRSSLGETVSFMNRAVSAENSFVSIVNGCKIDVIRNRLYTFVIPQDVYEKSVDAYGVKHYGFHWAVAKETNPVMEFDLGVIDPSSVKSQAVASPEFVNSHQVDEHPDELKSSDLSLVSFSKRDLLKSITVGPLPQVIDGHLHPTFTEAKNSELLIFESKDRAERFVTAFIHAISVCGGKTSDFAPTPSKP